MSDYDDSASDILELGCSASVMIKEDGNTSLDSAPSTRMSSVLSFYKGNCTPSSVRVHLTKACLDASGKMNWCRVPDSGGVVKLRDWTVWPAQETDGLIVKGHHEVDGAERQSCPIVSRIDAHRVVSSSGTVYELLGMMGKSKNAESELAHPFFGKGFPEDWVKKRQEYLDWFRRQTTECETFVSPRVKKLKKFVSSARKSPRIASLEEEDKENSFASDSDIFTAPFEAVKKSKKICRILDLASPTPKSANITHSFEDSTPHAQALNDDAVKQGVSIFSGFPPKTPTQLQRLGRVASSSDVDFMEEIRTPCARGSRVIRRTDRRLPAPDDIMDEIEWLASEPAADSHWFHHRTVNVSGATSIQRGVISAEKIGFMDDSKASETTISEWNIVLHGENICVEGKILSKDGPQTHRTGPVSRCVDRGRAIVTADGSKYTLAGKMNIEASLGAGIPLNIARRFSKGFPSGWKQCVKRLVDLDRSDRGSYQEGEKNNGELSIDLPVEPQNTDSVNSAKEQDVMPTPDGAGVIDCEVIPSADIENGDEEDILVSLSTLTPANTTRKSGVGANKVRKRSDVNSGKASERRVTKKKSKYAPALTPVAETKDHRSPVLQLLSPGGEESVYKTRSGRCVRSPTYKEAIFVTDEKTQAALYRAKVVLSPLALRENMARGMKESRSKGRRPRSEGKVTQQKSGKGSGRLTKSATKFDMRQRKGVAQQAQAVENIDCEEIDLPVISNRQYKVPLTRLPKKTSYSGEDVHRSGTAEATRIVTRSRKRSIENNNNDAVPAKVMKPSTSEKSTKRTTSRRTKAAEKQSETLSELPTKVNTRKKKNADKKETKSPEKVEKNTKQHTKRKGAARDTSLKKTRSRNGAKKNQHLEETTVAESVEDKILSSIQNTMDQPVVEETEENKPEPAKKTRGRKKQPKKDDSGKTKKSRKRGQVAVAAKDDSGKTKKSRKKRQVAVEAKQLKESEKPENRTSEGKEEDEVVTSEVKAPWKHSEKAKLNRLVDEDLTWDTIAEELGRSADECRDMYEDLYKQKKPKTKPKKPVNDGPKEITAKRGTLKHREQVREKLAVLKNPQKSADDFFGADDLFSDSNDMFSMDLFSANGGEMVPTTPFARPFNTSDDALATPAWFKTPTSTNAQANDSGWTPVMQYQTPANLKPNMSPKGEEFGMEKRRKEADRVIVQMRKTMMRGTLRQMAKEVGPISDSRGQKKKKKSKIDFTIFKPAEKERSDVDSSEEEDEYFEQL